MISSKPATEVLKGGEFLIKTSSPQEVWIPEERTEEQQMFADMTREFIEKRVHPNQQKIDKQETGLMERLLEEAGELGLLGAGIAMEYGGMGVDMNTESVLTEIIGTAPSVCVAFAAHTGIGTLPILYFGNEEQKQKYLAKLATGELKAAYCLTEPGSGSDALAARTKATLTEDGKHYLIEGQKMWITNAGFADLFTVFAQIDGKHFTGILVDANAENIRLGNEEDKMGIKGSSTRQVFFEGVKVPVENVLGEIGKGHKIAFNVLNIGRYKLGLMAVGGCKSATDQSVKYANERIQFGVPIASFGAIQHKLAEQAVKIYATESAHYRCSELLRQKIADLMEQGTDAAQAKLIAAEAYAIECAILKVLGSETLDYVVDEMVQVYGGNGFSEEYPAARFYRDARINRIFEGTNEINRLLAVDMLLKRAMRGQIDLMTPAKAVQKELMAIPDFGANGDHSFFAAERKAVKQAKKATLLVAGAAVQKFKKALGKQQEIIMNISDMLIDIYALESAVLRTEKLVGFRGEAACSHQIDLTKVYLSDAIERINLAAKHAVCGFAEGDELRALLMGIKRFTKYLPFNTIAARRRIANAMIESDGYCF